MISDSRSGSIWRPGTARDQPPSALCRQSIRASARIGFLSKQNEPLAVALAFSPGSLSVAVPVLGTALPRPQRGRARRGAAADADAIRFKAATGRLPPSSVGALVARPVPVPPFVSRRDRRFADSPVEGDGFEPSVPGTKEPVFVAEGELRGSNGGSQKRLFLNTVPMVRIHLPPAGSRVRT
jgi:hypothetical protein